jgi:hypothetical protein
MKGFELMASLSTHFAEHGNAGKSVIFWVGGKTYVPVAIKNENSVISVRLEQVGK